MNYFEKHIGDYIRDTVSLSMLEDGAYNRLMDQYYQTERPLPLDKKMVYRLARAVSTAERKAVDFVVETFFQRTENGYVQKRIAAEISRYQEKQRKAKASADARWNRQKPDANGYANASETHDADGMQSNMRTHSVGNAHQTPDTKHQTPDPNQNPRTASENSTTPGTAKSDGARASPGEISKAMRANGVLSQPADPRIIALAEQSVSVETVESACAEAKRSKPGESIGPAYVIAIVERWAKEAKAIDASGAQAPGDKQQKPPQDAWWLNEAGIDRKGRELGMFARNGESYSSFKDRIFVKLREGEKAA